jgi:uncharacterized protein YjiS (DUF1127 family)
MEMTMSSYVTRSLLAVVLFDLAAMALEGNKVRVAACRLDGCLERRRLAAAGLRELVAIGDRELRDIGLHRYDLWHLASGASAGDVQS